MSRHRPKPLCKPVAKVSSGSVIIPIYESPVTLKILPHKHGSPHPASPPAPSERKKYPSFKIVYYEGKHRVYRRRNTLDKAKELAKELASQLASDGIRSEFLTEQDRRIYVLAQKAVQPLAMEIDQACRHYAELRNRVKSGTLDDAVNFHNTFGHRVRLGATTNEVYLEYLQHLEKRGAGDYHVRDVFNLKTNRAKKATGRSGAIVSPDPQTANTIPRR